MTLFCYTHLRLTGALTSYCVGWHYEAVQVSFFSMYYLIFSDKTTVTKASILIYELSDRPLTKMLHISSTFSFDLCLNIRRFELLLWLLSLWPKQVWLSWELLLILIPHCPFLHLLTCILYNITRVIKTLCFLLICRCTGEWKDTSMDYTDSGNATSYHGYVGTV